jgi:glycosyltransferase involved in cell wall biosynthesis
MIVVFVNPVGVLGGTERMLLAMMSALKYEDSSIEIHLIVGSIGNLIETAQKLGVKVKVLPIPAQINQLGDSGIGGNRILGGLKLLFVVLLAYGAINKYLKQLRSLVREIDPDIIHSNGIKSHILTAMANIRRPLIWHIHDFYSTRPFIASVLRWFSKRAEVGIACSESVGEDARLVLPKLNVKVIYNAVDIDYFFPRPFRPLALEGIDTSTKSIKVGLAATFARWKGHDIFIEAASIIARDRPSLDIEFYIIGAPIYSTSGSQFNLEELQRFASDLRVADKIKFVGFQANMADVYLWLDLVVHASTEPEPFGYTIAEAMSCGRPVIVSRSGGAAELFINDVEAVAVNPGDAMTLAVTIQYLVCNPQQCQILGENARKKVVRAFSQNQLGNQLTLIYKLLAQPY